MKVGFMIVRGRMVLNFDGRGGLVELLSCSSRLRRSYRWIDVFIFCFFCFSEELKGAQVAVYFILSFQDSVFHRSELTRVNSIREICSRASNLNHG